MGFIKGSFKIAAGILLAIVILAVIIGAAASSKSGKEAQQKAIQDIHDDVAADQVKQYEIAKRGGAKMDACVQAGIVSAAYLQAKNETEYQRWKKTEGDDCAAAGVPK